MSTGKIGYEFTVQGQYYAQNDHGKNTLKFYKKIKFLLPEISSYVIGKKWEFYKGKDGVQKKRAVPNVKRQNTMKCFKYLIKNYYLDAALREKYPDYIKFRTYQVTTRKEVKLNDEMIKRFSIDCPIEDMNESQLIQFVAFKDLNVDLSSYFDLADKKIAVEMEVADQASNRPGIDRPLSEAEKDLLPPSDVRVSRVSEVEGEVEQPDMMDAFL